MNVSPSIFRAYDVRGVAGKDFDRKAVEEYERWYGSFPGVTLTIEVAEAIGKAYGTMVQRQGGSNIAVGWELRPFAEELVSALVRGIRATGCFVTDLGASLTPIVYFVTVHKGFDGGANVTGSHNVYFFNGFKMIKKDGRMIFGDELQQLRGIVEREEFTIRPQGGYARLDGYKLYREYFLNHIKLHRKMKVVIDTGNGSAGMFAPDLFRALGCDVVGLYIEPDARFPNHIPDPEESQTLVELQRRVLAERADLGIAFDADGDRVGFITERGNFIDADLALLALARDVLTRHPGKKILYDVKCSHLLEELIPTYSGIPLMHRTGHSFIKETLQRDREVILAGEVSGHFFFVEDYFRIDDGLWAAGRVLEILSRNSQPFSALFADIPRRVRTPEIKLPCSDEKKFVIAEQIQRDLSKRFPTNTIDGARIQVGERGWGLVRVSNTAPYLTVRVEAETEAETLRIKNVLADELEKFPEIGDRLNRSEVASLTGKLGWV